MGLWKWLGKADDDQTLGQRGEDIACRFLKKKGYTILERNFRCRAGEIDIVAKEGGDLVFLEVKARSSRFFGEPAEAVTARKQRQISKAALCYLEKNDYSGAARFDVVAIVLQQHQSPEVEVIRHAFELHYDD